MNIKSYYTIYILLGALLWCNRLAAQNATEGNIVDEALDMPEGLQQRNLDSLVYDWSVRAHLHDDDSCTSSNENPEFSTETYISRLSRMPNVIEMPYNDVVRRYIDQYCTRLRRSISIFLGASNFYIPIFEEALESYQLPLELKYLPIIESALNPKASSRSGAAGLWQFMIGTGKQYGLEVTSLIDERRDPIKSSYAAARYLKDLYQMFGDWTLVIASYNCGPNTVLKAIKRAGDVNDYWKIYNYLPQETRSYVPAFIAANYAMNYYCEHNICPLATSLPAAADTIHVSRNIYMEQIVELCGISQEEFTALNPQYRTNLIPGSGAPCVIKLPAQAISSFIAAGDTIYTYKLEQLEKHRKVVEVQENAAKGGKSVGTKTVTVRKGDTLGAIASRNGVSVAKIKQLNKLKNNDIRVGQKLRLR